jgi:prepilin-type N-terminal cleavage/methylation domain-containing protein
MRRSQSGFTLIELLIVISIIGTLAAVLLPRVLETRAAANASSDAFQLRNSHYTWLEVYKRAHNNGLPNKGGHKFVLSTWTSKLFDHTQENFDMYFSPGSRDGDSYYQELRGRLQLKDDPWLDIASTTSADTHYVGRAQKYMRSASQGAEEAWMATDNEGVWNFSDGTINILFNGGTVRSYSYPDLERIYGLGPMDKDNPVVTYGPNSPIEECQKLDI